MPGDLSLWPTIIEAAEKYQPMSQDAQSEAINEVKQYRPLFQ